MNQVYENIGGQNFWVGFLLGQILFVGGIVWLVASSRNQVTKKELPKTDTKIH